MFRKRNPHFGAVIGGITSLVTVGTALLGFWELVAARRNRRGATESGGDERGEGKAHRPGKSRASASAKGGKHQRAAAARS